MSFLCFDGYTCMGCSFCDIEYENGLFFSSIQCSAYLSPEEMALIAKFAETDARVHQREEWEMWDNLDNMSELWDDSETRLRIDGGKWHSAKHGIPSGDHSIRAFRKRLYNKLGRRLNRELIQEQIAA